MAKQIKISQIDAFTDKAFSGNPAGVTSGENLSKDEMQSIAREMNLAETAFISKSDKADFNLRWFTPAMEVDLCGHATVASIHYLTENKLIENNSDVTFDTRSGILKCRTENGKYFMQIPNFSMKNYDGNKNAILEALGLSESDLESESPFVLVENSYLYIHIKKLSSVGNIKPNYKDLLKLSNDGKEFGAVAVFTLETFDEESFAHLRFFAPYFGVDEDPVTGSANGPLLLVLKYLGIIKVENKDINLTFEQGDFINRRGRVSVRFINESKELYIAGNAVTVLKGELSF